MLVEIINHQRDYTFFKEIHDKYGETYTSLKKFKDIVPTTRATKDSIFENSISASDGLTTLLNKANE